MSHYYDFRRGSGGAFASRHAIECRCAKFNRSCSGCYYGIACDVGDHRSHERVVRNVAGRRFLLTAADLDASTPSTAFQAYAPGEDNGIGWI
jgi:hypothetical protein